MGMPNDKKCKGSLAKDGSKNCSKVNKIVQKGQVRYSYQKS